MVDPEHTLHCGPELSAFTGLDVLCHALESFTAVPYYNRGSKPSTPLQRPAYQGCNPVSDIWSGYALQQCAKYLPRVVSHPDDLEAREAMSLAATAAGVGFGNAGVHLPHGMSYPIASNVKNYRPKSGYKTAAITKNAIVPHGLSVVLSAPAVFRWTNSADPDKHLRAAQLLGINTANAKRDHAGELIAEYLLNLLSQWSFVPNGLSEIGYSQSDIDKLIKGTLPQRKVLDIAPKQASPDDIGKLFESSMKLF
jgi:hydroxyacid-oxoacid transhydrogenase